MNCLFKPLAGLSGALLTCALLHAQEIAKVDNSKLGPRAEPERSANDASVTTRKNARTLNLSIPAPRGIITDRLGKPLAQNKVGYQLGLEFDHSRDLDDQEVLQWARTRLAVAERLTELEWSISDRTLLEHYRHRRWLPFLFSSLVDPAKLEEVEEGLTEGLILHPFYYRFYPQRETMSHIVGYVRSKGKLPTGPINHGDPLFEETYGEEGLENTFDGELTGEPGERKIIFDDDGRRLLDEQTKRPQVGNTVVTTINLAWQKHAEKVLANSCRRGAFVVIDIPTGEVLVLASRPSYDNNVWIPRISQEDFDELLNDESKPLFARAYQGQYPPASSFKPVVALTALTNNVVEEWTKINCPAKIKIGYKWFHNHSKYPEGPIDVARALARSNNCWFYQIGMRTGPRSFLSVARRLGFGSVTGLPLYAEASGRIPTEEYVKEKYGRGFTDGDTANYSIGQAWEATPLQVAQSMAGIANGSVLPRLRLIRQVQDPSGGVLRAPEPEARNTLTLDPDAVQVVHKGMMQVVHAGYGTGKRGALSFTTIAAKTGTAQWNQNRELAWFAGFFPYENPRLAFAALYEGMPGEAVSGGKKAAPMVPRFFNPIASEIKQLIKPPAKAMIVEEEVILPAIPVEEEEEEGEPAVSGEGEGTGAAEGVLQTVPIERLGSEKPDPAESVPVEPADEVPPAVPVENAPVAVPVDENE